MRHVLYISYDGIDEKLASSQILPYLLGLSKKGFRITLLSYSKTKIDRRLIRALREKFLIKSIVTLRYHKRPAFLSSIFDIIMGIIVGLVITVRYRVDIIHARSYVSCFVALVLKTIVRKPYIFDIRGFLPEERLDSGDWSKNNLSYRVLKGIERKLYRRADFITTLTGKAKKIIVRDFKVDPARVEVIPTCVDLQLFNVDLKNEERIYDLVYFGSLGTWYLLEEMLQFFRSYISIKPDRRMLFLTDTKAEKILETAKKCGVNDKLIDVKFTRYESVPQVLATCRASIFFIKPCYSKFASCPTKLGESLAVGLPVLTNYGIGDVDDIVRTHKVGIVINAFSEAEYLRAARNLIGFLADNGTQARCKKLAGDYFSLEEAVKRYEGVYAKISKS